MTNATYPEPGRPVTILIDPFELSFVPDEGYNPAFQHTVRDLFESQVRLRLHDDSGEEQLGKVAGHIQEWLTIGGKPRITNVRIRRKNLAL